MQDTQSLDELVRLEKRQHWLQVRWGDLDLRFPISTRFSLDGGGRRVCDDGDRGEEEALELLFLLCWRPADNFEEVEEGVRRMTVVSREGLEGVLPVEKDDGVLPSAEKVLSGRGATRSGGEVVEEADAARGLGREEGWGRRDQHVVLERDGRSTTLFGEKQVS